MKIAVLNGSPQGQHSITLTYFQFLKTRFPGNQYTIIHISKDIRVIEEDRKRFHEIVDIVDSSDAVLWLYGVWVLLVPAQMLRFIELIRERKADSVFVGKYAASISTSIHYLDHFAEQYIRAESENLGMQFFDHLSLDMRDIMKTDKRDNLCLFFGYFANCISNARPLPKQTVPPLLSGFCYESGKPAHEFETSGKKILIISDAGRGVVLFHLRNLRP